MFVKPFPGLDVPDIERGGLLAAEGREVEPTTYWQRRIDDKDVEVVETVQTAAQPATSATSTSKSSK